MRASISTDSRKNNEIIEQIEIEDINLDNGSQSYFIYPDKNGSFNYPMKETLTKVNNKHPKDNSQKENMAEFMGELDMWSNKQALWNLNLLHEPERGKIVARVSIKKHHTTNIRNSSTIYCPSNKIFISKRQSRFPKKALRLESKGKY